MPPPMPISPTRTPAPRPIRTTMIVCIQGRSGKIGGICLEALPRLSHELQSCWRGRFVRLACKNRAGVDFDDGVFIWAAHIPAIFSREQHVIHVGERLTFALRTV